MVAEDNGEADLVAGLLAELGAPPRLWRRRMGVLPLADEADGGRPADFDAAVEALETSPLKS